MEKRDIEKIFAKKRRRRSQMSRLSFEKKIEILIELQKMVAGIRKDPRHIVWPS